MFCADEFRELIKKELPSGAFLRLDRGRALFVSDAPRRISGFTLKTEGFECELRDGLLYLTPELGFASRKLKPMLIQMLKSEGEAKDKLVRQALALCMREKNIEGIRLMQKILYGEEDDHEA